MLFVRTYLFGDQRVGLVRPSIGGRRGGAKSSIAPPERKFEALRPCLQAGRQGQGFTEMHYQNIVLLDPTQKAGLAGHVRVNHIRMSLYPRARPCQWQAAPRCQSPTKGVPSRSDRS